MSTNIDPNEFAFPPDPESDLLPQVDPDAAVPPLLPVFDDQRAGATAERYPEVYDEFTGIATLKSEVEPEPIPIGRTWLFDFGKGDFDMNGVTPRRSDGLSEELVIQQWIRRCLTTERYAYMGYPDWFGVEMDQVVSGELSGQVAHEHIIETVRDALLQHDRISEVDDFEVSEISGTLWIRCTVYLDRGEALDVAQPLRTL
jgi:hypothetical protein